MPSSDVCDDCKKSVNKYPYIILHDMNLGYWTTEEEILKGRGNRKDITRTYCICTATKEMNNE